MSRFFSSKLSQGAVHFSLLLLRCTFSYMLFRHGWDKLMHFSRYAKHFSNPLHIGSQNTLLLVIFAEVFCAFFVFIGLLGRLFSLLIFIEFLVILFCFRNLGVGNLELAILYGCSFLIVLITGPGRISMDGVLGR